MTKTKRLKFSDPWPDLILEGKKYTTWRIEDEKHICPGDTLILCREDGNEFGRAVVLWSKETTFADLTDEDRDGFERFASDKKMYEIFSYYYGIEVGPNTHLKVVRFRLI